MNTNISLKLDELKHLNEWYFGVDKDSKISTLHTDIENQTSPDDVYVLGILLNCSDKYESMAEKYLTKFVKLHPFSMEGWIELGSCLWKKGNLSISWKCYEKSISLQENKIAYRDMSMLCRQINDKKDGGYVLQSVELAHKAVKLDVADHKSWYILGNALTAKYFFYSNEIKDLCKALLSYTKSETYGGTINPDLYYNRGMVCQYLLDYQGALQAYHQAMTLDSKLVDSKRLFHELHTYILKINKALSDQMPYTHSHVRAFTAFATAYSGISVGSRLLKYGVNKNVNVAVKVLVDIIHTTPPYNYICTDIHGAILIVSFYNIAEGVRYFKVDNEVVIQHPILLERKDKEPSSSTHTEWANLRAVPILQVIDLKAVTVDGKAIPDEVIVPTVLKSILLNDNAANTSSRV